ncbi:universal stress protein [Orrella sp. 11846]|uniref:universal stress protein n=1 Tax=Orrella sp. 11846 TaxID=3409913 RepID=UPI003B5CC18E
MSNAIDADLIKTPARVVLATDLSARCDRALDRSVYLSRMWGSQLTAVTVTDPTTPLHQSVMWLEGQDEGAMLRLAHTQLRHDVPATDVPINFRFMKGTDTAGQIRAVVQEKQADLVVVAVSHNEPFGRFVLGSTVESLAQTVKVPILIVRQRALGPYRKIIVGTDFSPASRRALQLADVMFAQQVLTLYHARNPARGMSRPDAEQLIRINQEIIAQMRTFLEETPNLSEPQLVRPVAETGVFVRQLLSRVLEQETDLVVLGNRGAGGIKSLLLGSASGQLLQWLPCDVLLVP